MLRAVTGVSVLQVQRFKENGAVSFKVIGFYNVFVWNIARKYSVIGFIRKLKSC